jgi:plastocyanin
MRRVTVVLVVLIAACGSPEQTTLPETTTTATTATPATTATTATTTAPTGVPNLSITIAAFRFSGDQTGVVGDTVAVANSDAVGHTWTSTEAAFHSGVLSSGDTFTFTFDQPGTYGYFCQIHPEMTGSITIEG